MTSKTSVQRETAFSGLSDFKKWQKFQDLFAKIIGANISFLNTSGSFFTHSSDVTPTCSEIAKPADGYQQKPVHCIDESLQGGLKGEKSYLCEHSLLYFPLRIHLEGLTIGGLIVGPVLVGRREDEESCRKTCEKLRLDAENFLDRVREIKLFSHLALSVILDFLRGMTEHFLKRATEKREIERLMPGFISRSRESKDFFSAIHSNELANSLLDIAMGVVEGDSGSVLFFDEKEKSFYIKTARGIQAQAVKGTPISLKESVAGWVARRGKPVLIHKEVKNAVLKRRLRRPGIKSSIVIPMKFQDRVLGVFCLNAESSNRKFNQDNLLLLGQLGKLASVAFARMGAY
ncbi:MAG: PocR ligand-binding domain-containing protein [Candidatus Omnitrophica bacterium]|nr:PocR ligand-binding domain-containing protein [Candidatus Omnitrophota bacterium]